MPSLAGSGFANWRQPTCFCLSLSCLKDARLLRKPAVGKQVLTLSRSLWTIGQAIQTRRGYDGGCCRIRICACGEFESWATREGSDMTNPGGFETSLTLSLRLCLSGPTHLRGSESSAHRRRFSQMLSLTSGGGGRLRPIWTCRRSSERVPLAGGPQPQGRELPIGWI